MIIPMIGKPKYTNGGIKELLFKAFGNGIDKWNTFCIIMHITEYIREKPKIKHKP